MTGNYETVYILKSELADEGMKKFNEKIAGIVARRGGKVLGQKDLGKKQLAYRIGQSTRGHYFELDFEGDGPVIDDVERTLRLTEECVRFLTIRVNQPVRGGRSNE